MMVVIIGELAKINMVLRGPIRSKDRNSAASPRARPITPDRIRIGTLPPENHPVTLVPINNIVVVPSSMIAIARRITLTENDPIRVPAAVKNIAVQDQQYAAPSAASSPLYSINMSVCRSYENRHLE
jgi:hypothetical protein